MSEDNCVTQILEILGKIDLLIDLTEDLSATVDETTTTDEFMSIAGSANIFSLMKNLSLSKSILHNMSASMMDISRSQAIKHSDKSSGPSMNPLAAKSISKFIEVVKETEEERVSEEKNNIEPTEEEPLEKNVRKEKTAEELQKIEEEKERRRKENKNKNEEENKHVGNVVEYFKQKFEEEDEDE